MRKGIVNIILILGLYSVAGCYNRSGIPDLRETYTHTDTKPFGTFVAKKIVEAGFPGIEPKLVKRAFSKAYSETADTNSLYFCISRNLFLTEDDAQAMLDYVYTGNTLFISSADIDSVLLNRILSQQVKADALLEIMQIEYTTARVSLSEEIDSLKDTYSYYYKPFANYFSKINTSYNKVIGYNDMRKPNCFILFWGKGKLILHCDPRAFSNYFLLRGNNYRYLAHFLSLTSVPEVLYWDDYYNNQNIRRQGNRKFSTLSELMKHPPLAAAFWIFLFLLALYVLFNGKRRQRIIPVIKPNENSSIAFTETIARLYLQHHDNKNIAEKMITYFNEHIRKNYFLTANATSTDFISALSRKSGVSFEQTKELFDTIHTISSKIAVDDSELLILSRHIHEFYKNRN